MRKRGIVFAGLNPGNQKKVHVDRARPVARRVGRPAEPPLDLLAGGQERGRIECRLDLDDRVVEVGLVRDRSDRLGFVDRGTAQDADPFDRVQQPDRGSEVREAVADVRAETEVCGARGGPAQRETSTETSSTATGSGGSGLVARTTTPLAPKRSISVSAIAAHNRSSVLYDRAVATSAIASQTAP